MEKFTGLFTVLPLACGLLFAQADSPQAAAPATETRPATASPTSGSIPAIQQWRGTLVDASCASGTKSTASAASSASATAEADQSSGASDQNSSVDTGRPHRGHRNSATKASEPGCTVTNSTSIFALQTEGGQVMRFDSVGNSRAAETLKSKEKWTKDLTANKPIRAKVSGLLTGDTITVTSID
jgi:hypothetical protein